MKKSRSKVKVVQISELVTVRKLKFCTGLRNLVLTENSLSVFKIFHFAAIMGLKTCFLVQKCRFRSVLKRPARLPTFDFQPSNFVCEILGKLSQNDGHGFFF